MLGFIALFGLTAAQMTTVVTAVAVTFGSMAYQSSQAKKAKEDAEGRQQALTEEQAKAAARARAVQNAPVTKKQMQKIMEKRETDSLVDQYIEQDRQGPRIYTLPTAQPSSAVVRANEAIHKFLSGVA